jgi:hypothetical protein
VLIIGFFILQTDVSLFVSITSPLLSKASLCEEDDNHHIHRGCPDEGNDVKYFEHSALTI